jgi:hypothetical protein
MLEPSLQPSRRHMGERRREIATFGGGSRRSRAQYATRSTAVPSRWGKILRKLMGYALDRILEAPLSSLPLKCSHALSRLNAVPTTPNGVH